MQTVYGDQRYRPSPWLRRRGAIGAPRGGVPVGAAALRSLAQGGRVWTLGVGQGARLGAGPDRSNPQPGDVRRAGPRAKHGTRRSRWRADEIMNALREAAFEFVASPASYAERTGRPANVGVIGVALFKERVYQPPVSVSPPYRPYEGRKSAPYAANESAADSAAGSAQHRPSPAPAAPPVSTVSASPATPTSHIVGWAP